MLTTLLTVLLVSVSLILILLVVALQQGPEGGMGSAFGGGNSAGFFGASGGANIIVRATWIFGFIFFMLALTLSFVITRQHFNVSRELDTALPHESSVPPAPDAAQPQPVAPVPAK